MWSLGQFGNFSMIFSLTIKVKSPPSSGQSLPDYVNMQCYQMMLSAGYIIITLSFDSCNLSLSSYFGRHFFSYSSFWFDTTGPLLAGNKTVNPGWETTFFR